MEHPLVQEGGGKLWTSLNNLCPEKEANIFYDVKDGPVSLAPDFISKQSKRN